MSVHRTVSLRRFDRPVLPLEVPVLARVEAGLVPLPAPAGDAPLLAVLWTPGGAPAFSVAWAVRENGGLRVDGAWEKGTWVVHLGPVPVEDRAKS